MSKFRLKDFFPSEIGSPRAGQLDVFSKLDLVLADPDVKYYMIDAPVGVGKSAIVASIIKYFEHADINSVILTPLKYLQDQYSDVFPDIPNIKGRANYVCPVEHDRNGNAVTAAEASCSFGTQCHYSKQNPGNVVTTQSGTKHWPTRISYPISGTSCWRESSCARRW